MDEYIGSPASAPATKTDLIARWATWLVLAAYAVAAAGIIFRDPLYVGLDEGMEFSKMLLVARHAEVLSRVWNDQPWLHSWVFGNLFHLTGFSPVWPRMFALLCAIGYCVLLRRFMPAGSGRWHQLAGIVLFLSFPTVTYLSVSAMLELPATLLALVGAAVLFDSPRKHPALTLVLGGALAAVALQIKLTAGMVLGAATLGFIVERASRVLREKNTGLWRAALKSYLIWIGGFAFVFLLLIWLVPSFPLNLLWTSHTAAAANMSAADRELYAFGPLDFVQLGTTAFGFVLGAVQLLRRSRQGRWLLPVCYGFCAMAIHLWHRPFWDYYRIHFGAACAPIAGWYLTEQILLTVRSSNKETAALRGRHVFTIMVWTGLLSLWFVTDGARTRREVSELFKRETPEQNNVVVFLRSVSPQVTWVFSRDNIVVARAGLLMVPETTVLPKKRFWAGYREEDLVAAVEKYKPEAIVLLARVEEKDARWQPLLASYDRVMESGDEVIYVSRSVKIRPPVVQSGREQLKSLGL